MYKLPCLLFDKDARLCHISNSSPHPLPDTEELESQFFHSLRSGDRKQFVRFCASSPAHDGRPVSCELFSLIGLPTFRYAFCEKNIAGGQLLNVVYLSEDIVSFHRMMSPASLEYSRLTDRLIRELLICAGNPSPASRMVTPHTLLSLQHFPTLVQSLLSPDDSNLCDVFRVTEQIVREIQETPLFLHTAIDYRAAAPDPARRILKLPTPLYVHLLTSVLTALLTLSEDHRILLELCPIPMSGGQPLAVDIALSTRLRDPEEFPSDSGQLRFLAVPDSINETLLAAASVLAYLAGIEPSYYISPSTQMLRLHLALLPAEDRARPGFRYRDPYRDIRTVMEEVLRFREFPDAL